MKKPVYWKGNKEKNESRSSHLGLSLSQHWKDNKMKPEPPLDTSSSIKKNDTIKIAFCLFFLIASCGLWIAVGSQFRWLVFLLLFVPGYVCGEWLSSKIFSSESGMRISQNDFSILRIIYGVIIVIGLFGAIFVLGILLSYLLSTNS